MTKSALFLPLLAIIFFTGCKVTRQINKTDTKQESQTKVDSSGSVKKDVTKESNIESTVTEVIDTTVFLTPAGELITDSARVVPASIPVKVRKTKTTKTHAEIKEVDKTHAKTELKKAAQQETKVVTTDKDVQKSGFILAWYWWLLIIIAALVALAYKFRRFIF